MKILMVVVGLCLFVCCSMGCASLQGALPPFVDVLSGGRPLGIGGAYTTVKKHTVDGVEKEADTNTREFGLTFGFQVHDKDE